MDFISGNDRHQISMISLDQMVDKEAFVRIIDAFVDTLDLYSFGFENSKLNKEGRPPFHPSILLKLYLYGYQHGIRSCRKLEHASKVNVEVMWLLKGLQPHYKTIANFRKYNSKPFRMVFRAFVSTLKDWKLVDGKQIAIDSFKVRAQNSLKNNFNQKKLDRHFEYIDSKINEYLEQLGENDDPEQLARLQSKINHQVNNWNKYYDLQEELERSGEDQLSKVDPDAKAVVLHRNIVNVGYNVQAVSDSLHKMVVGIDTGTVNDTHELSPMVGLAQQNLGVNKMHVLADKGYHTGRELEACEKIGVTTFVSPKANSANKQYKVFPMESFKYHPGSDTYRCPNNAILRSNGTWYERNTRARKRNWVKFKHYKTKSCLTCPIKDQCTSSPRGRVIQRSIHQGAIDRNNRRVNANPEYYRNRQQIIEHQFGTIKRQWGFTHVLVRGKEKVLGEVSLLFTAYNLRRSVSILGFNVLLNRLKAAILEYYSKFCTDSLRGVCQIVNTILWLRCAVRGHVLNEIKN